MRHTDALRRWIGWVNAESTRNNVKRTWHHVKKRHGELTQAELAERVNLSRQTIVAIEQGKYSRSLEVAFQITRVFGVPLDDVFQYRKTKETDE